MTHTVRITGPGIDHTALITSREDIEAARAVLDKIERDVFPPLCPERIEIARCSRCGRLPRPTLMGRTICDNCGGFDVPQPPPKIKGE